MTNAKTTKTAKSNGQATTKIRNGKGKQNLRYALGAHGVAAPNGDDETKLVDLPLSDVGASAASAIASLQAVRAALPNPTRLTSVERKHSGGRLRTGESEILQIVATVAAMPKYAPLLTSLADHDFGLDPNAFEPGLLADRLKKVDALTPLADGLASLAQDLSDTVLDLQTLARQPLLDAYAILKSVAKNDAQLKGLLKDVIDHYASVANAAAKTRKAKKAAAAQPAKTT